jgi:integrase
MATIRKRYGKWQAQIRRQGFPSLTKSFQSRKDAETWSREQERQIDLGEHPVSPVQDFTLGEILTRYEREVSAHKKGKDTEKWRIGKLKRDSIASIPVARLDGPTLSKFRDRRIKDGVRACQLDLITIRHAISIAQKEWGLALKVNPVSEIRVPNGVRSRNRRLEEGEYDKLAEAAKSLRKPWTWPAVNLALETAMRRSELLKLKWTDVDLSARLAHLHDTKNGHPRSVPLTHEAVTILKSLPRHGEYVFPISATSLRQSWEGLVSRAGITDLHFHDLRHEAVSRFFEKGLSIAEVALISGHRDPRMLFRYTHLRAEDVVQRLRQSAE